MKSLIVFGITGSIGRSTIEIVKKYSEKFKIIGASARKNLEDLAKIAEEFKIPYLVVEKEEDAKKLVKKLSYKAEIGFGKNGLKELSQLPEADILVIGISGIMGLVPTYYGLLKGKRIALANKECVVAAGKVVKQAEKQGKGEIIPVDSEHSSLFQLFFYSKKDIEKILITASGGPFYFFPKEKFKDITPEMAVKHPTWEMGAKISVDSATLMNKGFEVIEAMELFEIPPDKIEVLIHPQSIVHGLIKIKDGSIFAHMSIPDMKIPILYALTYPERFPLNLELDLTQIGKLEFFPPDMEKFPCLKLAYKVAYEGGCKPLILEAADEVVVDLFLNKQISFDQIPYFLDKIVEKLDSPKDILSLSIDEILEYHQEIKKFTKEFICSQ